MLKVDIKSKVYKMKNGNTYKALDNVKFKLGDKGIVCILGPSGSGKTTLMNIIGGLDSDFDGDVIINNQSLKSFSQNELNNYRKEKIGFVFQQFYLINKFTSYDNIAVALDISSAKQKDKKIKELLKNVNMQNYSYRRANVLSGGQKQRIAIARALANDPDIILADEPTGALDSATTEDIMQIFKKLSESKLVLIITHSEELVQKYADQVIKIEDGKLIDLDQTQKLDQNKEDNENKESKKSKINSKKMSIFSAFKHSFKSILNRKGRTLAIAIGLSIGIVGVGMSLALSNGTIKFTKSQIESIMPTNMVKIADKKHETSDNISEKYQVTYTMNDVNDIKNIDKDIKAFWLTPKFGMSEFFTEVSLSEKDAKTDNVENTSFITQNGFEPAENVSDAITYGRMPQNKDEIVISLNTAEYLNGDDKNKPSDLINKDLFAKFQKFNKKDELQICKFKIVGITNINTMGYSMYQNSTDMIKVYSDVTNIAVDDMQFIMVYGYLDRSLNSNQIKSNIDNFNNSQDKYIMEGAADTTLNYVQTFMDVLNNILIGFSSISIIIAVLMIGIVTFISVIERTSEIGILRAIGARKKDIHRIFLFDAIFVGLLSGLIGIAITNVLSNILNNSISKILLKYGLNIGTVNIAILSNINQFEIIILCIILSIIAAVIPANKAAKLDPIVALKRD